MEIKASSSSGKEIIASGSIISIENESIIIHLSDLKFEFRFTKDGTDSPKTLLELKSKKELLITLNNFNNSLGTGNTSPAKIGTINNKDLLLSYWVQSLPGEKQDRKLLYYSFYLENQNAQK